MATGAGVSLDRRRLGTGRPIVLVHGTACDGESFRLLEPLLADDFSVVTVDRRGRGQSGDAEEYSLEAEFDDVVAVVDELDEPVVLFGHSYGANVALGAALRSQNVSGLVLYEPGRTGDVRLALRDEISRLIARNERGAAMRLALREFTDFPEEWLDDLLETPAWKRRLTYAHTIARELQAYEVFDYGDLSELAIPTLLLVGSESPPEDLAHARALAARLRSARVAVLRGQGHAAAITAPALVAAEIVAFAAPNAAARLAP
jgi:pimeloyl-ACP methyl ester carboxylesterase